MSKGELGLPPIDPHETGRSELLHDYWSRKKRLLSSSLFCCWCPSLIPEVSPPNPHPILPPLPNRLPVAVLRSFNSLLYMVRIMVRCLQIDLNGLVWVQRNQTRGGPTRTPPTKPEHRSGLVFGSVGETHSDKAEPCTQPLVLWENYQLKFHL